MFFRGLTLVSENMPIIISIRATYYGKTALQKIENFVHFGALYFKNKKNLAFSICYLSNTLANFSCFQKFERQGSIIVEITGRQTCYFVSLDIT